MMTEEMEKHLNNKENIDIVATTTDGKQFKKTLRNNIMRPAKDAKEYIKRWNLIHLFVKKRLIHPGIKIVSRIIGKYLIKSINDIPKENYNNHQRILYHSYIKGIEEAYGKVIHDWGARIQGPRTITKEDAIDNFFKNSPSGTARVLMLNLFMTEVLEDTFDRAVVDYTMLEIYHQLHKLYKGKTTEFRAYDSHEARDVKYFMETMNIPIWEAKQ